MDLYLQLGYGMMEHTRHLLTEWQGSGAILSPRDLDRTQLISLARKIRDLGAEVLLDPQCYVHSADHHRLIRHEYFQVFRDHSTSALLGQDANRELLVTLAELIEEMNCDCVVLPGLIASSIDEDWFTVQDSLLVAASDVFVDRPYLATIAISNEEMKNEDGIEAIVERAADWNASGFYVVAETPGPYLVDDPVWLANLLILTAGLKLHGRRVIVGYCNHQSLCLAAANVDILASGTFLNVRAFPPAKFDNVEDKDPSQRATWYYCPQSLSEYKVPFLDIAKRNGVLDLMKPDDDEMAKYGKNLFGKTRYAEALFGTAQPSTVAWKERDAFRHYLSCLHSQAKVSKASSFKTALDIQRASLDAAEQLLTQLRQNGVFGQDREFTKYLDVNRSALTTLSRARGFQLERTWK